MLKICKICNKEFSKPINCSKKEWNTRIYCSQKCCKLDRIGKKLSKKTIMKMKKNHWLKKNGHTEESKRKIGEANKISNLGKQLGHIVTEETRDKIRNALIGRKRPEFTGEKHPCWKGGKENTYMLLRKRRALKRNSEGSHTLDEWNKLKEKYNYTCLCCGKQEPKIKLTEDHIIPLSLGGNNYIENIQPLCISCNSSKRIKTTDYRIEFIYT